MTATRQKALFLMRHGDTEYPHDELGRKRIYDWDAHLTPQGRQDIQLVAQEVKRICETLGTTPQEIHTSHFVRAMETADIIQQTVFGEPQDKRIIHPDLRDVDLPTYIGNVVGSKPKNYYDEPLPDGHETLGQLTDRAMKTVTTILENSREDVVILVSHRDTIMSIAYALEHPENPIPDDFEALLAEYNVERGDGILFSHSVEKTFTKEAVIRVENLRHQAEGSVKKEM